MASFHLLPEAWLMHLVLTYGVWAVFVSVAIESTGLPVPSESILIAVAILSAGDDPHAPAIATVVLAAIAGAVLGDNLGYAIGRSAGAAILARFGAKISLGPSRQRLGRYLFQRFGGRIVIAARFVSVLRTAVSLLAGTTRMPWPRFLLCNALGGVAWGCIIGGGAYLLGERLRAWSWPVSLGFLALVLAALILGAIRLRRDVAALQSEADEKLLPHDA